MASTLTEHRSTAAKEYVNTSGSGSTTVETINTLNPAGGNITIAAGGGINVGSAGSTITVANTGVTTINSQAPAASDFVIQAATHSGLDVTSTAGSVVFDSDLTNAAYAAMGGSSLATPLGTGVWAIFPTGSGIAPTFTVGAGNAGLWRMSGFAQIFFQASAVPFKYMRIRWQNTTSGVTIGEQTYRGDESSTNGSTVEISLALDCLAELAVSDVIQLQFRIETPSSGSYSSLTAGRHRERAVLLFKS